MKEKMIMMVVSMLVERLSAADLKKWADMGLDMLENAIAASPSKYDDKLALPIITAVRTAFSIEDND